MVLSSVERPGIAWRTPLALADDLSLDSPRAALPYFRPMRRAFTPSTQAAPPGGTRTMFDVAVSALTSPRWDLQHEVERAAALGFDAISLWRPKVSDVGAASAAAMLSVAGIRVSSLQWAGGFTGGDGRSFAESLDDAIERVVRAEFTEDNLRERLDEADGLQVLLRLDGFEHELAHRPGAADRYADHRRPLSPRRRSGCARGRCCRGAQSLRVRGERHRRGCRLGAVE